ncbi:MAG: leucine-rich repeat domain-containing protein, partial [Cyanobacteria bacterium P01_D01_bin.6]
MTMKNAIALVLLLVVITSAGDGNSLAQDKRLPTNMATFETFADWCLNQDNLPPEAQHTVRVLLAEVETQDCDQAAEQLTNLTGLSLQGRQMRDLTPLASLPQLTKLGLIANRIVDVTPLAGLTNLTQLSMSGNLLEDVAP